MDQIVKLAVSAVLLAGLYAVMAYGLGLIYGVLRIVNLAHAGTIMAGAYATWVLYTRVGIDPYLSIPIVVVTFFLFGMALYKGLVRFLTSEAASGIQSLLLLFGVPLAMRNFLNDSAYLSLKNIERSTVRSNPGGGWL